MVGFNNSRIQTDKRQKMILVSIILSISVLLLASIFVSFYKPVIMNTDYNITNQNANDILTNSDNQVNKAANSSYAVMEGGRNIMLHYQNATTQLPMASTTKIMTAYIACISGKLNDTVTIPKVAVGVEGSSVYLKEGEKYKLIDLVYGLMLRSGNDAAEAIAWYLGGGIEGFAKIMNEQVKMMGLKNTNFVNPHGLHDDNHYTSAYDLAYITCEALKNSDFKKICSTKSYKFKVIDGENKCYVNKNKLLNLYDDCIGVKTGYTKKAGRCLVSAAERNGVTIVSVVLNQYDMWNLSMSNLNRGFEQTKGILIAKGGESFAKIKTQNGQVLDLGFEKDIYYSALKNEKINITYDININNNLPENVKKGEIIGEIKFFNDKHLIFTQKIYTI